MALELPDWNEGIKLQWEAPAPKTQLQAGRAQGVGRVRAGIQGAAAGAVQRKLQAEEVAGLRAEGLNALPNALDAQFWLRKAAVEDQTGRPEVALQVLKEALERDVRPVTDVLRAMQDLSKRMQADEAPAEATGSILGDASNRAPAGRFTPSKTGLTGRAMRVLSRFAPQQTPGGARAAVERGEVPATALAAPTTLTKRLNFSAAKPALTGARQVDAEPAGQISDSPSAGPARQPGGSRHVSFGAGTISPAARPAVRRQSHVQFQTPEPIDEAEADSPTPNKVNSVGAGRTPYDSSRLSGLFRKYRLSDTLAASSGDEEEGGSSDDGLVGKSPSWRALSASLSVSDSIRGLSKKYSSDVESLALSSPEFSPLPYTPLRPSSEAKSHQSTGNSPALAPTPHHLLEGWQPNNLYESPTQGAEAPAAAATGTSAAAVEHAAGGAGTVAAAAAAAGQPAAEFVQEAEQQGASAAMPKAATAPVTLGTLEQIRNDATQQGGPLLAGKITPSGAVHLDTATAAPAFPEHPGTEGSPVGNTATPTSLGDIDLSPISLADTELVAAGTPVDGVPRDAAGIPLITPATVTVGRGGRQSPHSFRDDGLAADLFASFDSPQSFGQEEFSFAPADSLPPMEEEDVDTPNIQPRGSGEQQVGIQAGSPASQASPEILGHVEQQEVAGLGSLEAPASLLPRSILKGQLAAADGTPPLGRAQRVPSPTKVPRGTATKELRALMATLSIKDNELEGMGTLPMLSPVRAHGHLRSQLGLEKVVTPVRRSARNQGPHTSLDTMLEQTDFSYVPNQALLPEDAKLKREKQPKSAKKSAVKVAAEEEVAAAAAAVEPNRRIAQGRLASSAGASSAAGHEREQASQQEPSTARRYNLRLSSVRTPSSQGGVSLREGREEVSTPPPASLQAPVPQDGSPALQESLAFAAAPPAAAPAAGRSTRKAASYSTPAAPPAATGTQQGASAAAVTPTAAAVGQQAVSMSPTEQGIRAALRSASKSSARKSTTRGG